MTTGSMRMPMRTTRFGGCMMTGTSKIAIAAALLLLAASAWAQTVTPPNAVGSGSSISPGTLTCPAGSNCNLGQYNVNNEINPDSAPYVANPRTSAVTSVTATTTASSPVVALSSTNGFVNGEGIAIYGAGPNCNINSTYCGSITVTTPTVTQTGYTGAASRSEE